MYLPKLSLISIMMMMNQWRWKSRWQKKKKKKERRRRKKKIMMMKMTSMKKMKKTKMKKPSKRTKTRKNRKMKKDSVDGSEDESSNDGDEEDESSNDEKDSVDGDEEDKSSNDEKDSVDGDEEDKSSNDEKDSADGDEEDESSNNEEEEEEESAGIKGEEDEQVSEDSDEDELVQYGAGKPIPPPEIEAFVPNMTFPTAQEVEYLNNYTIYQDAVHERINNRLVVLKNNCIKLRRLDKIRGMTLEEHVEKIFDIFIRKMIQQARGTLEKTKFWARLRHLGPSVEEFHVNHCTYTKGNGHVLMNNVSKRMQSGKEIAFDEQLEFSMFIFKEQDTAGRGGHTINDRIKASFKKKILRLDRQFVQTDGYCLPASIVIGRCKSDMLSNLKNAEEKSAAKLMYRRLTRVGVKTSINQYREAKTLLRECGLDENTSTHDADDLKIIARHLKDYQIAVWYFDPHHQNVVIRDHFNVGAPGFIGLYFENNHYEFFVPHTGPESLMTTFCHRCCTLINHQKPEYNSHSRNCRAVCPRCGWATCVPGGQIRVCPDCEVTFFSDTCFQYHTEKRSASAFPHCKKYRYCKQCCNSVIRTEYSGLEHECGKGYCVVCRSLQSSDHDCCHAPPDAKEREKALLKQLRWRFFIYDIETITRSESAVPDGPPTKNEPEHVPNLICGRFICNECVGNEECRYCGPIVKFSYKFEKTEGTTIEQFIRFLQTDVRLANTTLLAHNGGGYDHGFVLSELATSARVTPDLLLNGNRVIQAEVNIPNLGLLTFKDTLSFLPMPLSQMPGAFGLEGMKKGTFPHLFNHPDHYGSKLNGLPDVEYYQPSFMTPPAKLEFLKWYEEHKNEEFDFDSELENYCADDVQILVKAVKKYLQICAEMFAGWNPIVQCATMPSFIMFVMKHEHFRVGQVGYIPENGFPGRNNSKFALKYLQWLDSQDPTLAIEHALNKGEKRIPCGGGCSYYADGYSEAHNTVFEVYGCVFHGCRRCFTSRTTHSPCRPNMSMEDLYQQTILRQANIENAGFVVEAKWECEINDELAKNCKMKQFFKECRHTSHLIPRESMFGGRTQAFQAIAVADAEHTIEYFDYCSLYPFTNMKGAQYPMGQPRVIRTDFDPIVPKAAIGYRGLVYCDVLPPTDLAIPVLPYRARGKLLFPLCRSCAETPPTGAADCSHTEEKERFLTGCWVSEELNLAIKKGYRVLKFHEVWSWPDNRWFRGGFFESFLSPLLRIKHMASGWPRAKMTEEEKKEHVLAIEKNDGIRIDTADVVKNPALRNLSKLFLNSSWGKFAQNPQKVEMRLYDIGDGEGVFRFLDSKLHEPTCLELWGKNHLLVARKPLADALKTTRFCNVVYGSITTAVARIRLYAAMEAVGAENLIYTGKSHTYTDSVIFRQKRGANVLGELRGEGLGKMTNEVPEGLRIMLNHLRKCGGGGGGGGGGGESVLTGHKISLKRGTKRPLDPPKSLLVTKRLRPMVDKGRLLPDGSIQPLGSSNLKIVKNYPFNK
ncbi:hypothetical protein CAEBREN_26171 [Caenorhabditis brenneri]|uniref:DNA-directed DNA polymerase n=1 Tax=Caenorhabditis brenneri TaxID=135651 RepID=G0NY66_CAEBE|nr:hypothetical protein CAEBREN_26171 [Caenorhabditis brenneri]